MPTPTDAPPELPRLSPGVWLLETDRRDLASLHSLVIDHLLLAGGTGVWIDARGHGRTQLLRELAPSARLLDRIHIARGFTAFQHAAIVEAAAEELDDETAMVVAPAVESLYRDDDVRGVAPRELLLRSLARLARYAREHEVPVVLTRTGEDHLGRPVASLAGDVVSVERTRFGPRFVADAFETLVYPSTRGPVQTTLAFWERVLAARRPLYPDVPGLGTTEVPVGEVGHGAH
ncbi:MAG: hypothetical protein ABEJ59_03075 [Halanaeroarchaeum sp.]